MDPRSEVILRQQQLLQGQVLLVNAPADGLRTQLDTTVAKAVSLQYWSWHAGDAAQLNAQGANVTFAVEIDAANIQQVVIYIPKSKTLLAYVLHHLSSQLALGSEIFLVGEKKGGIESAAKQLSPYGKVIKLDSARHCQLWQVKLAHHPQVKALNEWVQRYEIEWAQQRLTICALPGVFSQNHLDVGTAVLLPYLLQVKGKRLADFGCGAGVISACLAIQNPQAKIFALDVDAFALASTRLTFAANGLVDAAKYQVKTVTGIQDAPTGLDAIISNPPFHQGIHTHYSATEDLCRESVKHLKAHGQLLIVANRFLQYEPIIQQHFHQLNKLTEQQGFKVMQAKP